jgi:hypothetical protein
MGDLQTQLLTNTWVRASWDEYIQAIAPANPLIEEKGGL